MLDGKTNVVVEMPMNNLNKIVSPSALAIAKKYDYSVSALPDPLKNEKMNGKWVGKVKVVGFEIALVNDIVKLPADQQPRDVTEDPEWVRSLIEKMFCEGGRLNKPITLKRDPITNKKILMGGFHRHSGHEIENKETIAAWLLEFTSKEAELDYLAAENRHLDNGAILKEPDMLRYLHQLKRHNIFVGLDRDQVKELASTKVKDNCSKIGNRALGNVVGKFMNNVFPPQMETKTLPQWGAEIKKEWKDADVDKKLNTIHNDNLALTFQTHAVPQFIGSMCNHFRTKIVELQGEGLTLAEAKEWVHDLSIEGIGVVSAGQSVSSRQTALKQLRHFNMFEMLWSTIDTVKFLRQKNDGKETTHLVYDWSSAEKEWIKRK